MTTSHELAQRLLALPDATVYAEDPAEPNTVYEVDSAFIQNGYVIVSTSPLFLELEDEDEDEEYRPDPDSSDARVLRDHDRPYGCTS